ncbi:hypothetical protein Hanom_Chr09g00793681 [Helianthus anomalus]
MLALGPFRGVLGYNGLVIRSLWAVLRCLRLGRFAVLALGPFRGACAWAVSRCPVAVVFVAHKF